LAARATAFATHAGPRVAALTRVPVLTAALMCALAHYYTTNLSSIAQNAFSLGDFGDRD
jgi:hypothetical protein